ncbi:hypothetical protein QR680_006616 [Steinernema hermaphroditum]|uniref:Uncharacterized protein n=1 Tax=Steinernema hermaphroditum TaxID=289476 RepID=A0AA39HXK9_9BILA|nr:hypothetical protein QR680_006616 [Steinernema hermaphroditum]
MLSANDKINMSLDDIIKMEKREKKAFTPKKRSDSNNKKAVKKDIVQKKAFKKGRSKFQSAKKGPFQGNKKRFVQKNQKFKK